MNIRDDLASIEPCVLFFSFAVKSIKVGDSSTSYNGLSTTITNALGHQKTTTKNIIGKVIRIDEPKGAWLTHHYDSIGNLI
jgi:uncharacterized protein RhaS with RHS repeats